MKLTHPLVTATLATVKATGLNQFRCNVTGAPYATLDDSEIEIALSAMIAMEPTINADRLLDQWTLKALTFNSQSLPSLRGANQKALASMLPHGANGSAKVLTYLMTRLFFPHIGAEPMPTQKARDRMLFAIDLYDQAMNPDSDFGTKAADLVQKLSVVDSYLSMPYWHTLWLFESAFSKVGLAKSPAAIQEAFANPAVLIGNVDRIESVIKFMYQLMLNCAERDGAAGKSGNRLAQEIMFIQAAALPRQVVPHFQKTLSQADMIRMENKRRIDSKQELRIAHSAIHGKKFKAGVTGVEANAKIIKEQLAKVRESKPKKASTINPLMRSAFDALKLKL